MADRTVSVALQLKTAGFTSGLRKAKQDAQNFGESLSKEARKNKADWDRVGNGLAGVGAVAGLGLAAAVRSFANFDQAMSNVKAATHETAGNMGLLRDAALQAGKDTAFSATEAAGGIEALAKAGVSTQDILNGGLKGALDLAAAGELDVADAADTAATAMTQFGLQGDQVPHIADLLAAAAGKAQGEVSDMAQALNQSGLVASQMGLSIEETTATLGAFASAGLLGSDAGTSFKTMLLQLANPSGEAAETMKQLGINAYDAQGAFIGIAPLAEQLKTKLGGLSQEQRDAALSTIFGSDAIRAANVLYSQGAAGIADWAVKVNDAGYAAETAAIKQDNLKGDIEKLGGSFETALIKSGSGANDALRGLAQSAGLVVDGFAGLPDSVQEVGLGLAAVATTGGLAAGGLLKATSAASQAREAWSNLGKAGRGLTLSMGAVGLALTAGLALYGAFSKKNAEAAARAEDLRSTLDEQTGAITKNTQAYVANDLATSGIAQKAKDLGLNLSLVTSAALGNEDALAKVRTQLEAIEAANMDPDTGALGDQAKAAREVGLALGDMNTGLSEAQRQSKLAAEGAQQNKSAQEIQAEAVKKANEQIQQQTQDLNDQIEALHKSSTAALTLSGSQIAVESAIDNAAASLKENGRTLNINTEAGRQNRTALDDIARAANSETDAMLKSGKSHTAVSKNVETSRAAFSRVAQQMGLSKKQADALATALIDIPPKKNTSVTVTGAGAAKANVDALKDSIDALKSKAVTVTVNHLERGPKTGVGGREFEGPGAADGAYWPNGIPSYADGKLPSAATIQPGHGRGLVQWAEDETDGEAFIPLATSKRQRSLKILTQVAHHFDLEVVKPMADGAFLPSGPVFTGGARLGAPGTGGGNGSSPIYVDNHIEIGGEVVRVVRTEIKDSNRQLKRQVTSGRLH